MAAKSVQRRLWALVRTQHGVVARRQLLELGYTQAHIRHRLERGRLHRIHRGVYAVGRPELTQRGRWMAAVLACGPGAVLSDLTAALLWGMRKRGATHIHVTVPAAKNPRIPGVKVHRRTAVAAARKDGIPVTTPIQTIVHLAARATPRELEALINEADALDLVHPCELRAGVEELPPQPGLKAVRELLDRQTLTLTRSELERRFLRIAERAGLPPPQTNVEVNGFEVDFYFPDLDLVVETDGGRFHRTPAQQTRDRVREHAHAVAGVEPLRFTHGQVAFDEAHVEATLRAVCARITAGGRRSAALA